MPNRRNIKDRFWEKVVAGGPDGTCWLWTAYCVKGYGQFCVRAGLVVLAHRFSWELVNGPILEGLFVLHDCDDKYPKLSKEYRKCINPSHLRLGTNQDNVDDMMRKGRHRGLGGEASGMAKLTNKLVRKLRLRHTMEQVSYRQLGREYGLSHQTVRSAIIGISWKHVK